MRDQNKQRILSLMLHKRWCLIAALLLTTQTSMPVRGGDIELSDQQNAKLARHKAKERVRKNERLSSYVENENKTASDKNDQDECGTIDIGNITNDSILGSIRSIDLIITGDVINANNHCN